MAPASRRLRVALAPTPAIPSACRQQRAPRSSAASRSALASERRSAVQVGARRRQPGRTAGTLRRQHLEDLEGSVREGERHPRQIGGPQPRPLVSRQRACLAGALCETPAPEPRGARVVLAPALDIVHLEATCFEHLGGVPYVVELEAWEDVALDEATLIEFYAYSGIQFGQKLGDNAFNRKNEEYAFRG